MKEQHRKVYEYIIKCLDSGYSPSVREICSELDIASTSTASRYVSALVAEGYLIKDNSKSRTLRLAGAQPVRVPIISDDNETTGHTVFRSEYLRDTDELFALRMNGDGLRAFGILDGDTVIFLRSDFAQRGDIVCAVSEGRYIIRRFVNGPVGYILTAENESINADDVSVTGRAVGVIRDLTG